MPSDSNSPPSEEAVSGRVENVAGGKANAPVDPAGDPLSFFMHEMRNFIAPVRNAVYLLRKGGTSEAQVRAIADIIEKQASGMSKLLDNLADADRLSRETHGGGLAANELAGAAPRETADRSASRSGSTRRRVLIVDDNAALRETFSDLMQEMGHEVLVAAEGFQALDMAKRSMPEFVFLDINMPNLNGYEVARQLRAQFQAEAMRLVMMSGDTLTDSVVQRARQAGFDHCIDKIGDLEVLRELLNAKP